MSIQSPDSRPIARERPATPIGRTDARDLLRIADLSPRRLRALIDLADAVKDGHGWWTADPRPGTTVALLHHELPTETRVSFEVAAHRLGVPPILVPAEALGPGWRAPLSDTARVLSSYVACIAASGFSQTALEELAGSAAVPVLNAGNGDHHPAQALADLLTLRRRFGRLGGLRLAYVGRPGNVAYSLIEAAALAGMHVAFASPRGHEPLGDVIAAAAAVASARGGSVRVIRDPRDAARGADAVYTSSWSRDGDGGGPVAASDPYRVGPALMRLASPAACFMHPLPAHRGQEVAAAVLDGPQSLVWEQAANRLPAEQALLLSLVRAQEAMERP